MNKSAPSIKGLVVTGSMRMSPLLTLSLVSHVCQFTLINSHFHKISSNAIFSNQNSIYYIQGSKFSNFLSTALKISSETTCNSTRIVNTSQALTITGSCFSQLMDRAQGPGGALYYEASGNVNILNSQFQYCHSVKFGGGMYINRANTVNINFTTIYFCTTLDVGDSGGGLYATGITGNILIFECSISMCKSKISGGGIYVDGSLNRLQVNRTQFSENSVSGEPEITKGASICLSSTNQNCNLFLFFCTFSLDYNTDSEAGLAIYCNTNFEMFHTNFSYPLIPVDENISTALIYINNTHQVNLFFLDICLLNISRLSVASNELYFFQLANNSSYSSINLQLNIQTLIYLPVSFNLSATQYLWNINLGLAAQFAPLNVRNPSSDPTFIPQPTASQINPPTIITPNQNLPQPTAQPSDKILGMSKVGFAFLIIGIIIIVFGLIAGILLIMKNCNCSFGKGDDINRVSYVY